MTIENTKKGKVEVLFEGIEGKIGVFHVEFRSLLAEFEILPFLSASHARFVDIFGDAK